MKTTACIEYCSFRDEVSVHLKVMQIMFNVINSSTCLRCVVYKECKLHWELEEIPPPRHSQPNSSILIVVLSIFVYSMQDNQQMLKDVVTFIILVKLPRHVSAANCHLQGVTHFLLSYSSFACTSGGCGLRAAGHNKQTITHILRHRQNWSSLQGTCSPLKMAVSGKPLWFHGSWPNQANHNPHPPEAQTKLE
jgi:hypothetical protein